MEQRCFIQHCVGIYTVLQDSYFQQRYYHMVHKKEEGTYHHIEKLTRVASPGSMHDTGCLGLVHWDYPEGWYGEGGGRRV